MKKTFSITILFCLTQFAFAQQTLPFYDNFEGANNWTIVNGTQTNKWFIDTATFVSSNHSIYISDNGGTTNMYSNSSSITHFYADFIATQSGCVTLEFDWKCLGEPGFDFMSVYKTNKTVSPQAGVAMIVNGTTLLIGGPYVNQANVQHAIINFSAASNDTVRLVFSWVNDNSGNFQPPASVDNIAFTVQPGQANDVPCLATSLPFNTWTPGDNTCAGNSDEPAPPACFNNANATQINTVWYNFTAPASGCVKIKTKASIFFDTQIALYGGVSTPVLCSFGSTLNFIDCNDNAPTCGFSSSQSSELNVDSLTPGLIYYLEVDGGYAATDTFSVLLIDGGANCQNNFPPIYAQDCASPIPVCADSILIPDPGYQGNGNICDFSSTYCLVSGERSSAWFKITIALAGQLMFDIIPNDYMSGFATDYDFIIWRMDSVGGSVACFQLFTDTIPPAACNFNVEKLTGCYINGNSPPAYPGYDDGYEIPINVLPGEIYYLVAQNYANNGSGFKLRLVNTAPGVIATCGVGAAEITNNNFYFTVRPNPLTNQSEIKYVLHSTATVQTDVVNVLGQKVKSFNTEIQSAGTHSFTINKSDINNGIYLVRIVVDGKTFVKRLVVN